MTVAVLHDLRVCAFAMASTALLFAGGATAAEEIRIGGTGAGLGTMHLLAAAFTKKNPDVKVTVLPSLGSGGGIKAVANGAIDIAVSARSLTEDERKLGLAESEYARTPFVFAVSAKSKVTAITTAQIADLYAGRMETWPDGSRIRPILRPAGDADSDQIKKIAPAVAAGLINAEKVPGTPFALTDQEAANGIESIPGAFGATTLALIKSEDRALRALGLDGVAATVQNAASSRYPHFKSMYLVIPSKQAAAARRFVSFLRSPEGVNILVRNGHWIP